jgi:hypothetical protein
MLLGGNAGFGVSARGLQLGRNCGEEETECPEP